MKLGTYTMIIIVMIVFLEFIGLPTTLSTVLEYFGVSINSVTHQLVTADMGGSGLWLKIFAVLTAISAGGAVIVGLFAKSYDTSLVILPLIIAVGGVLITTFWAITLLAMATGQDWVIKLVATVFIGLGIGFAWSCVDYFAGR